MEARPRSEALRASAVNPRQMAATPLAAGNIFDYWSCRVQTAHGVRRMTGYEMFWPIVAHIVLVFILYGLLGLRRSAAVKAGSAEAHQFRENRDEPAESLFVRSNLANQFELPVLFYAISMVLFITQADNIPAVILAWIFVASRYAHSYVHVTSNNLRYRSPLFILGFLALLGMFAWLVIWMAFS
jgi:hypothetical protein